MNTHATTIRRGIATVAATAAFFAFAACGSETSPPPQDIGSTQEQKETTPPSPTKTSPTRGTFGDENGTASPERATSGQRAGKQRSGQQKDWRSFDPVDRRRDWH